MMQTEFGGDTHGIGCFAPLLSKMCLYKQNIYGEVIMIVAFDTPTGMPYGTVNLKYGVPAGETPVTCTAGVGTFIVEFGALSRLTGDPIFETVATRAMDAIWERRSPIGMVNSDLFCAVDTYCRSLKVSDYSTFTALSALSFFPMSFSALRFSITLQHDLL